MLLWLLLTTLFVLLVLHPYTTYPLSLRLLARLGGRRPIRFGSAPTPRSFDLVFCAYNEGASIAAKITNCEAIVACHGNVKVHLFNDGSSDETGTIAADHADRIRFVDNRARSGKSVGMNRLLAGCDGEITVFTDANVLLDEAGFAHLARYFSDPDVGCVCGHLVYVNPGESSTASVGSAYWRLEEAIKELETATGSVMGADGSIFAIRRTLFRNVPEDIIDDFFTSFSILCDGRRLVRAPEVMAYELSATQSDDELRRKVRIACRSFNAHRALWPRLRRLGALDLYKYISHKLLRWLAALWMVLATLSALAFAASIGLLWPALGIGLLGGGGLLVAHRAEIRPLAALSEIIIAYAATSYGVWRSIRGDRFQTWDAARSTR